MKTNNHEITVVTQCPFCGKAHEVEVNEMDYLDWQDGELAQDAFPYLSADERELLISGICPTCWDGMFGGKDDTPFEDLFEALNDTFPEDEGFEIKII